MVEGDDPNCVKDHSNLEIKVYSRRWWILTCFAGQVLAIRMMMNSIGVVNNVYKAYFNISYYVIDWFTLIQTPGRIISAIVLATLIFYSKIRFRLLLVTMSTCAVALCVCSMLSFAYPGLYGLIFLGQGAIGFGFQAADPIICSLAIKWFPEHQIGFAMSFKIMSMCVGCLLAYLVPSQLLVPPPSSPATRNCSSSESEFSTWYDDVRRKCLIFYGVLLSVCLLFAISTIILAADDPPKPPSLAQAIAKQQRINQPSRIFSFQSIKHYFEECKSIMLDTVILQAVVMQSISFSSDYLEKILMGQVVRDVLIHHNRAAQATAISGYALVCFEVGGIFGSLLSGKAVDLVKKNKIIMVFCMVLSALSMIGLTVGRIYFSIGAVIVCNTILGFSLCLCEIPIFDIVFQQSYPKEPAFVILLFIGESMILVIFVGQACRLLFELINGTSVLIFLTILLLISLGVSLSIKPKYNRREAGQKEKTFTENVPLLNHNIN